MQEVSCIPTFEAKHCLNQVCLPIRRLVTNEQDPPLEPLLSGVAARTCILTSTDSESVVLQLKELCDFDSPENDTVSCPMQLGDSQEVPNPEHKGLHLKPSEAVKISETLDHDQREQLYLIHTSTSNRASPCWPGSARFLIVV